MNRGHFWKLIFILFVVVWAITEIYPPMPRNLAEQFNEPATLNRDATVDTIVQRARELDRQDSKRGYRNLLDAIGTNQVAKYFPTNYVNLAVERDPTRAIL